MSVRHRLESKHTVEQLAAVPNGGERRLRTRGGVEGEPSRAQLVALILGTYAEMPGLSLNLQQAARLFGLREATCLTVLSDLVREGRLRQAADGQYRSATSGGV